MIREENRHISDIIWTQQIYLTIHTNLYIYATTIFKKAINLKESMEEYLGEHGG